MAKFAANTTVSAEKTQGEILGVLRKYGATGFAFGQDEGFGHVMFKAAGRMVRFDLPLEVDRKTFSGRMGNGMWRTAEQIDAKVDQEIRRRWRALLLAIKAKLEVVESGISTFEEEFLAHIVLPDGTTVGTWAAPQLESVYADGGRHMPPMLPGAGRRELTS